MTPAERAELEEWVRESRASQGLPPKITDAAGLRRLAGILHESERRHERERSEE